MYTIRMHSKADMAKGHGVLSAYEEQVSLVKKYLGKDFKVKDAFLSKDGKTYKGIDGK